MAMFCINSSALYNKLSQTGLTVERFDFRFSFSSLGISRARSFEIRKLPSCVSNSFYTFLFFIVRKNCFSWVKQLTQYSNITFLTQIIFVHFSSSDGTEQDSVCFLI